MKLDCDERIRILKGGLRKLTSQLYAEEVFSLVADAVKRLLAPLSCGILIVEDEENLKVKISRGLSYSYIKELHASPSHELASHVMENPQVLVVKEGEPLYGKGFEHAYKSLAIVPLLKGKEVTGVLFADSEDPNLFEGNVLDFLDDMALLTAMALDYHETKEKLVSSINVDTLTGLYNFKHFHELLFREVLRAEEIGHPFSLALFSIAGMTDYNSAFGHVKGDKLLVDVAILIGERVRRFDVAARYSGAKIAVIMPEAGKKEAREKAQEIIEAFEEREWAKTEPRYIYFKGALATYPQDATDEKDLLRELEQCLYEAKRFKASKLVVWGE